jgi:hypothetical protein
MPEVFAVTANNTTWEPPPVQPLDEAKWKAWVQRGKARDHRSKATRLNVVKGISIATLLAGAVLWRNAAPYEFALLAMVTAGAIYVLSQAIQERRIAFAALFAALAVLYNPAVPLVHSFGGWQRAAMVASTIPFVLSLVWGPVTEESKT